MRHYLNKTHETEHTKPRAPAHTHTHIETHIVQQWTRAREMCARQFMISGSAHAFDEVHVCMFSQTFSTTNAGRFHYNPEYPAPHPPPPHSLQALHRQSASSACARRIIYLHILSGRQPFVFRSTRARGFSFTPFGRSAHIISGIYDVCTTHTPCMCMYIHPVASVIMCRIHAL